MRRELGNARVDTQSISSAGRPGMACGTLLVSLWSHHVAVLRSCCAHFPCLCGVAGKELFSPETAVDMLALIDGAQMWVENLATRPDAERFEKVRKTFTDARERLHRKMHEHGIPH
jgi:hypothetical protein